MENQELFDSRAEQNVLGAMMQSKETIGEVSEIIKNSSAFSNTKNSLIFDTILSLYNSGESIDVTSVRTELSNKKQLDIIGTPVYLIDLVDSTPSTITATFHAKRVQDLYVRRQIQKAGQEIAASSTKEGEASIILDEASTKIINIDSQNSTQDYVSFSEGVRLTLEEYENQANSKDSIVKTGNIDIDNALGGGMRPGQLVVIGARPSVGKSTLLLDIARNSVFKQKNATLYFSLEEPFELIMSKLLSAELEISSKNLRDNKLSNEDKQKISELQTNFKDAPLYIDTSAYLLSEIRSRAKRLAHKLSIEGRTLSLIAIDYLQLVKDNATSRQGRVAEVGEISRGLKLLAKELNLVIITGAQLTRPSKNLDMEAQNKMPTMNDLRESGSIEQDADTILLLHRYDLGEGNLLPQTKCRIEKNRIGQRGINVNLLLNGGLSKFVRAANENIDESNIPPDPDASIAPGFEPPAPTASPNIPPKEDNYPIPF